MLEKDSDTKSDYYKDIWNNSNNDFDNDVKYLVITNYFYYLFSIALGTEIFEVINQVSKS